MYEVIFKEKLPYVLISQIRWYGCLVGMVLDNGQILKSQESLMLGHNF